MRECQYRTVASNPKLGPRMPSTTQTKFLAISRKHTKVFHSGSSLYEYYINARAP